MVWVEISLQVSTDHHVFLTQSINANMYILDILEEYVMTSSHYIGGILFLYRTLQAHNTSNIITWCITPMK
jgi:hypothetical protein